MPAYAITGVTVADGPDVARNNVSAFWEDKNWIVAWPQGTELSYLIEQSMLRQPHRLLMQRTARRHQKAVDPETGRLLGYARWILPGGFDREDVWSEALVPDVDETEKQRLKKQDSAAWWGTRPEVDVLDDKVVAAKNRILAERPYLRLDYLAVHPENKGKGVATALVQSGIRVAKELGLDIFILAFKGGYGVYTRLGFREVERVVQDDSMFGGPGEYAVFFMIYDVKKTGEEETREGMVGGDVK